VRILHIAGICPTKPSGASRSVVDLACGLKKNHGIDSVVIGTLAAHSVFAKRLDDAGVQLINHFVPPALSTPLAVLPSIRKVLAATRAPRVDIVHAHAYVAIPLVIALARRAALVVTARGAISRLKRTGLLRWAHRQAYIRARALVAISEHVKRDLIQGLAAPHLPVRVIHNGCDTEEFSPGEPSCAQGLIERLRGAGRTILGVVGRVDTDKGCETVLDLAEVTRSQMPHLAFVFVGTGDMEEGLRAECNRRGLSQRIFFLGHQQEMVSVYRQIDILLHLCPDEGFGLVFIEAMACGKPVVAAAGSAVHEIVVLGETGFICQPGNWDEWKNALRVLGSPEARDRMGLAGRLRVQESFSLNATCAAYAKLYAHVRARTAP
jgi:glycosyltransferase involved in cell wall biosynthesis